ncbi:MAG: NAD(P)-dependent oxidoreductase [Herminiimonas sp.]|nr:NAD(P)-dependent oxidoreductase [Herminiimonas sp.]MDB5853783.1 NAD(P)-dependent oxidoreductase [Herminiimonas sp.]
MAEARQQSIGVLGLGIMGSAISTNLIAAGFHVVGFDPSTDRMNDFIGKGGSPAGSPREMAATCDIMMSMLPSAAALDDVVGGPDGILASGRSGLVLIESSTLPIEVKQRNHDLAAPALTILDCPLSGTGAQAINKDVTVYASGEQAAIDRCLGIFDGFARSNYYVGPFGSGSKMKFVANLLVAIHNVAAAEAFVLGMKAGLDPALILKVVAEGAGGSRMFSVRGPQMVSGDYEPATMKVSIWQKDMKIIADFATSLDCPTPLLSASAPIYTAAMAQGRGAQDTAAVCAVLEDMARNQRTAHTT